MNPEERCQCRATARGIIEGEATRPDVMSWGGPSGEPTSLVHRRSLCGPPTDNERMWMDRQRFKPTPVTAKLPVEYWGVDVTQYIMDLEALIRWLALSFSYQDQEGEWHVNDPIWTVYDERGTHLPAAEKLQETWNKVMHP